MSETSRDSPEAWPVVKLKELANVRSGYGFPKRLQGKNEGDFPFFKVGDISAAWQDNRPVLGRAMHYLDEPQLQEIGARTFPAGATVFAKIGAAIALNRRAMLREPSLVDNNVMALIPNERVVDKFLFYFTWTLRLEELSRATTVPSIRKTDVQEIDVPLPPIGTQKEVVANLERQLTALEQAEGQLGRAIRNVARYRASVLEAACQGRLVPTEAELARQEDRDYEPADVLLDRILAERQAHWEAEELEKLKTKGKDPKDDRWKKKYKEPKGPDTGALPELPEGWVWATAEQLTHANRSITYGVVKLGKDDPNGVPTLRSSNVRPLRLELEDVKQISPEISSKYDRTVLEGSEVVITVRGTLGGVAAVPDACQGFNISREVAMLSLVRMEAADLVAHFIAAPQLQAWLSRKTRGIAYSGINIGDLKELPIPLPPRTEQRRILETLQAQLSVIARERTALRDIGRLGGALRNAVLKAAFRGSLAGTREATDSIETPTK